MKNKIKNENHDVAYWSIAICALTQSQSQSQIISFFVNFIIINFLHE